MSKVTWLHLSDLYFHGAEQQTWDDSIVLKKLMADVAERIQGDDLRPDFIVVTGDVAFSGQPTDYELAGAFFDQLLQTTGLGKDRLFLVPGNHDVDRGAISLLADGATAILSNPKAVDRLLASDTDRALVMQRLHNYWAFVNQFLGPHSSCDSKHYFYVRRLSVAGQRVALLGLNSAWLCASGEDTASELLLGQRQVQKALDEAGKEQASIKIALLHHSFDSLRDFDRAVVKPMLCEDCDFVLHGYLPGGDILTLRSPNAKAVILAAGACSDIGESDRTYNWVQLNQASQSGTVYLRRYSPTGRGFWAPDAFACQNMPTGTCTFPFPFPPADSSVASSASQASGSPSERKSPPTVPPEPPNSRDAKEQHRRHRIKINKGAIGGLALVILLIALVMTFRLLAKGSPSGDPTPTATLTATSTAIPAATLTAAPTTTPTLITAPTISPMPSPPVPTMARPSVTNTPTPCPDAGVPCPCRHPTGAITESVVIDVKPGWVFYAHGERFLDADGVLCTKCFITVTGPYSNTHMIYNGVYCQPVLANSDEASKTRDMLVEECKDRCPNEIALP